MFIAEVTEYREQEIIKAKKEGKTSISFESVEVDYRYNYSDTPFVKEYYDIADNKVKYVLTYQFMLYYLYTKTDKDVLYKNFVISEIQQYGDFYYSVDGTDITVFNGIGSKRTKFETILLDLQCIKEVINC